MVLSDTVYKSHSHLNTVARFDVNVIKFLWHTISCDQQRHSWIAFIVPSNDWNRSGMDYFYL